MIKVRFIEGGYEDADNSLDYFLETVQFPQEQELFNEEEDDFETVTIRNEDELRAWADKAFDQYNIWTMTIPEGAIVREEDGA